MLLHNAVLFILKKIECGEEIRIPLLVLTVLTLNLPTQNTITLQTLQLCF